MFICLVVPGGGGDVTAFISLSANYLPVKEKGLKTPHTCQPKLTPQRPVCYCHNVLTLSLPGQSYRFRRGAFSSYWWWYARAEGAIH